MDVVLVAPEIATNTGNIIRLCANTGAGLHLVGPLGFSMDSALLRRAGLDYHDLARVSVHDDLPGCLAALGPGRRWLTFRSQARRRYDTVRYRADDVLAFGAESAGLTPGQRDVLDRHAAPTALRLPMRPGNRSLNLANAVAVVVYEAWRQHDFAGSAPAAGGDTPAGPAPGHGLTGETLLTPPFDP